MLVSGVGGTTTDWRCTSGSRADHWTVDVFVTISDWVEIDPSSFSTDTHGNSSDLWSRICHQKLVAETYTVSCINNL